MKFLLRFSLLLGGVYFCHFSGFAQPNFLATGLSSSWQYHALTDLGNVRQVTVSAGCVGGSCNEWAFLVNNNFGTCGAPSCAVWRPYNTGSTAVPFNSVIVPNSGSNYGALYNNGSSGGNQGNPGYFNAPTVGRHYTFNITENATSDNTFEILETTYFPANLAGTNTTTTGGNISITGLPTLSSGENLFLRYSTSPTMATSTLLELTPSGGSASVNLPMNCAATTVYYYFYTSSKTSGSILADVGTHGEIAHELSALRVLMPTLGNYYSFTFGGPVVVTSSAGTNTTATAYTDLGAAATAINGTIHEGVITIDINGTHPTITSTITFTNDVNNTSILIRPSCGATRTLSGNISGQFIYLNGADNVTIDGLNTGGNALVIENTNNSNTANTSTIQLNNDAIGCIIQNCEIRGSSLVATAQGVISVLASAGTIGCDNTTIQNNKITRAGANYPTNGIVLAGATTATLNDIAILNNEIYDFFNAGADCAGVRANGNTVGVTVSGNHFYQTQPLTFAASGSIIFAPIHFSSTANTDNIIITNNFIGGSTINCGGTALTINNSSNVVRAIKVSTSIAPSIGASIQGNVIRNMTITSLSSSNAHAAISLVTGKFKIGNITGNTIGSTNAATGINFTTNSINAGVFFAGISCGSGTVDTAIIKNNTINNFTVSGTTTSQLKLRGINATGTGYYQISNNTIKNLSNSIAVSTSAVSGITFAGTTIGTNTISQNQITDLSTSAGAVVVGIETGTGANPTLTIHENTVKRLVNTSTSTVTGIAFSFANTTSTQSITNNTVDSLVNLAGTATTGISFGGAGQSNVFTNNIAKRLL
ncbi:MAG: beta strand repeat-containing protein, partial [Bacteroidia bacterium]